jgi:hypothetical protein
MLIKGGQLPPGLEGPESTKKQYNNIMGLGTEASHPDEIRVTEEATETGDGYEEQMVKYEAQIRNHISVE